MKVVPIKLSDSLTDKLDSLVREGMYSSRNEALKDAVRSLVERRTLGEIEERKRVQIELQTVARTAAAYLIEKSGIAISKIILFGSAVKGEVNEESDIDLLIITKGGDRHNLRRRFIEEVMPITHRLGRYISIKVFTEEELENLIKMGSPFIREVLTYGVLLFRTEGNS